MLTLNGFILHCPSLGHGAHSALYHGAMGAFATSVRSVTVAHMGREGLECIQEGSHSPPTLARAVPSPVWPLFHAGDR